LTVKRLSSAAMHGGPSSAKLDILPFDMCSLTLGIEITDGVLTKLVSRNTPITTRKSQMYVQAIVVVHALLIAPLV
jgi:molecular chaperone DnaK (HSP70)